jgi:hypothetical protein
MSYYFEFLHFFSKQAMCISDIAINETPLTNIADDTRILTKVMIGFAD